MYKSIIAVVLLLTTHSLAVKISVYYDVGLLSNWGFFQNNGLKNLQSAFQDPVFFDFIPFGNTTLIDGPNSKTYAANQFHSCVLDATPKSADKLTFVDCSMKFVIPYSRHSLERCAKAVNVSSDYLKECMKTSDEGYQLLMRNGERTKRLPSNTTFPHIVIDTSYE